MKGTLYGVGIGPGDPKLMTFRAAELIRDNEIIALPGEKAEETVAYKVPVFIVAYTPSVFPFNTFSVFSVSISLKCSFV